MGGRGSSSGRAGGSNSNSTQLSKLLQKIDVNDKWAYQPDDYTDLNDLRKNPIPYIGVGEDFKIGLQTEDAIQKSYKSDVDIDISKLKTFQPFVLASGIDNYKSWDGSDRPYVIEYKGGFYLLDGNHRVAKAKLQGKKKIKVDISVRVDR